MNIDQVYTPDWVAEDMVKHFKPSGKILDPSAGAGDAKVFLKYLPKGTKFCEIEDGFDFFVCTGKYDWIITNPPYSIFPEFLKHALNAAQNVVFLVPTFKIFNSGGIINQIRKFGWMKEIRFYGGGHKLGFPMGNITGAVHIVRGYKLETKFSFYQ
jgi:hypothetical protein